MGSRGSPTMVFAIVNSRVMRMAGPGLRGCAAGSTPLGQRHALRVRARGAGAARRVELTLRSNAVGLLSDCPSRDERQGWLGDGHAIINTFLHSPTAPR